MNDMICPVSGETHLEERVNHFTHLFGVVLSLIGLPVLIVYGTLHGDFWHIASYSIYGVSLVLLYLASTYYHGCLCPEKKNKLRVVDHACIYLLIAGSYTPFALGPLRETSGWMLLGIEWGIAAAGILFKLFAIDRFQTLSLAGYLVMGWLVVFSWPTLMEELSPTSLALLVSGGLSYTFGVVFFAWASLPFNHAIWHLFVLGGSACHYFAILGIL